MGIKSFLRDRKLLLNANLYQTYVEDYQAITSELDPTAASGYSSILGNIPRSARGVGLDVAYNATPGLRFNFGVAFNDAVYTDWATATCPRAPCRRARCFATTRASRSSARRSGRNLRPGLSARARQRIHGPRVRESYLPLEQNLEQLLSPYGYQGDYTVTDVGFGFTRDAGSVTYELNIVGKNVFDTQYTTSVNDFSNNQPVGFDGIRPRRYLGIDLRLTF